MNSASMLLFLREIDQGLFQEPCNYLDLSYFVANAAQFVQRRPFAKRNQEE